MKGEKARVIRDINPAGKVELQGEIWMAASTICNITAGTMVKIVATRELILTVDRFDGQEAVKPGVMP